MPDVTWRRNGELLHSLFEILHDHSDGVPAAQAIQRVEERVTLTPHEAGLYPNGVRRFVKIIRFATISCVKAGRLVKERGRWFLTDAGWQAHKQYRETEELVRRSVALYNEWKKGRPVGIDDEESIDVPEERASATITLETADEQAWAEIERYLHAIEPYEFQKLVAALLSAMGYHVAWIAPPGKDFGTDIVAYNDPLGTRPPRIKVQVKRQEAKVSVDGLRSFMAVLGADDVGIFVNAGGFTKDAEDEARTQHTRRITLISLGRLVDLWKEHYARLDEASRRLLPLQPIHFLALEA